MTTQNEPDKVLASQSYRKALNNAAEYAKDARKLQDLIERAGRKADDSKSGRLAEVRESLSAMFRLLRAYAKGNYREIPWKSLTLIIASVSYFVMPLDLIPDFIVALGLFDDIALITWTVSAIKADLDAFTTWEKDKPLEPELKSDMEDDA
ncbi:MAG: YkvA family protein [Pseudomonadota bacterium]